MSASGPHQVVLRRRWPPGLFGWLAYFTDYCIFGFEQPVDWLRNMADDVSIDQEMEWPLPSPDSVKGEEARGMNGE